LLAIAATAATARAQVDRPLQGEILLVLSAA